MMLGPENAQMGNRSAKTLGASPVTLYMPTENVDKVVAKAVKLGATQKGPVMDMFWGDRTGTVVDPDGNSWMVVTHVADMTPKEMNTAMKKMMKEMSAQASGAGTGS